MKLIYNNYLDHLIDNYRKAKEVLIISPYITLDVVQRILSTECSETERILTLVTLPPGEEYVDRASDPKAIYELKQAGFSIYLLERLHAKIYLFDRQVLYLGSANMTTNGLGLIDKGNREILIRRRIQERDTGELLNNFLTDATEVNPQKDWLKKMQHLIQKIDPITKQDNYDEILNQIRSSLYEKDTESKQFHFLNRLHKDGVISRFEHLPSGYYKHAYLINGYPTKVFRSKHGTHDLKTFSYQITPPTARLIRQKKIKAVIFVLEEDAEHFVCLPAGFLIDYVLVNNFINQADDWQIKIKRNTSLWLFPHGKKMKYDISAYEGQFHTKKIRKSEYHILK